eukprot:403353401
MRQLPIMNILLILLPIFLLRIQAQHKYQDGVLILNNDNFDEEVSSHDYILVYFYTRQCYDCKQFTMEYQKAAKRLQSQSQAFILAKIDTSTEKYIAERFAIQKYPTLLFFKEGVQLEYDGGQLESDIVGWFLKKASTIAPEISCMQIPEKVSENKLIVVFFGDTFSYEYNKIFLELLTYSSVSYVKKYSFYHLNDAQCAKHYGIAYQPKLSLFRQFDLTLKPIIYNGNWEVQPILQFLSLNLVENVIEFKEDHIELIFGQNSDQNSKQSKNKPAIMLFRQQPQKGSPVTGYIKVFHEVASQFKEDILFVQPAIRILDTSTAQLKKYAYSQTSLPHMTKETLTQFIRDFVGKNIRSHYRSQEVPQINSRSKSIAGPVKILVGQTFNQEVIDHDKDVLVLFHSTEGQHCLNVLQLWSALGNQLVVVRNLVLATLDISKNDIPPPSTHSHPHLQDVAGFEVTAIPQIKIFRKGHKDQPIDYHGEMSLSGWQQFLNDNSRAYREYLHLEQVKMDSKNNNNNDM